MKRIEERLVLKKSIRKAINKILLLIIIYLIGMILIKGNNNLKDILREEIYEKSIPIIKNKINYEKYFGKLLPKDNTTQVFNEKLSYESEKKYKNGVKLKVSDNYMIPSIESGVVIYIGEKEDGQTIIIEQVNGIETMYSNININNIKLYDYLEKGDLIGESKSNYIYLSFQKDGKYLNYKEYI